MRRWADEVSDDVDEEDAGASGGASLYGGGQDAGATWGGGAAASDSFQAVSIVDAHQARRPEKVSRIGDAGPEEERMARWRHTREVVLASIAGCKQVLASLSPGQWPGATRDVQAQLRVLELQLQAGEAAMSARSRSSQVAPAEPSKPKRASRAWRGRVGRATEPPKSTTHAHPVRVLNRFESLAHGAT